MSIKSIKIYPSSNFFSTSSIIKSGVEAPAVKPTTE